MREKRYGLFFRGIRAIARVILPRYTFEKKVRSDEPTVFVAHHQNMIGPISLLVWLKHYLRTWVLSVFTTQKACYDHYLNFTFTKRYGWPRSIAKLIAWPASYLIPWLVKSARAIPVYRGSRKILETFERSVEALKNGEDLLIFPDIDYSSDSTETSEIYEGFLHLEKYYFRKTGEHVTFVPVVVDRQMKKVRSGDPIRFLGEKKFIVERKEIAEQLVDELNRLSR